MDLVELPDRYDALLFLVGDEPVFVGTQVELTRDAVAQVISVFSALKERRAAGPDVLRNFVLQCVWSMFAEDLGMVPEHRFTRLVEGLIEDRKRSSADELGGLFRWLNDPASERPQHGAYARVPYANGGLFAEPASVHLGREELDLLRAACGHDWTKVQPQIFGWAAMRRPGFAVPRSGFPHWKDPRGMMQRRSTGGSFLGARRAAGWGETGGPAGR